jgi:16S rRNA (guanine527-N7)-methyltransferase
MFLDNHERGLLENGLIRLSIYHEATHPPYEVTRKFSAFLHELLLWSGSTNLMGTTDRSEIIVRHILDSLTVYHLLKNRKGSILDVGAGAGFPSIPLKIVEPGLEIYAVERRRKRASFLRNVSVVLSLENYFVIEGDVRNVKGSYDTVLVRGVGELLLIHELTKRVVKEKAMIIAFKGKITEIEKEVARLKGKASAEKDYSLQIQKVKVPYLDEEERNIVIIETK